MEAWGEEEEGCRLGETKGWCEQTGTPQERSLQHTPPGQTDHRARRSPAGTRSAAEPRACSAQQSHAVLIAASQDFGFQVRYGGAGAAGTLRASPRLQASWLWLFDSLIW